MDDFRLPRLGYLVRGPGGFLEYRAIQNGEIADRVHCDEYDYFSCPKPMDFGPLITDGAVAVTRQGNDHIVVYEVLKPSGITLKLGELSGTHRSQRALQAWAVLTRDCCVELTFPDIRQPSDLADRSKLGNQVQLRPVEMRDALRYEIVLTRPNVSDPK